MKWLLIGKWKEEVIPIWSLRYFRFWLVKTLIQTAPIAAFVGSPLYIFYLRLLGMKIGRNTVVAPGSVPVCTDLISVGSNTILRRETLALGYKAQSNYIYTGPISIGDNAYVGEGSVLDINTAMEDGTQLGHASSLQAGQRVPRGRRHHGSPGQETTANYCTVGAKACTPLRRALYSAYQLFVMFALVAPMTILLGYYVFQYLNAYTSAHLIHEQLGSALLFLTIEMLIVSSSVFLALSPSGC